MEHASELYRDWLGAFESIGMAAIGRDTAARVLAVTLVHGNNEGMAMSEKYLSDIRHIQQMYHVKGGDTPDMELSRLLRHYVDELEEYRRVHDDKAPKCAGKMFKEKYGIKLINL